MEGQVTRLGSRGLWLVSLICLLGIHLNGQEALDTKHIQAHTTYFNLDNGFTGDGAQVLKEEISQSRFIAFGELHNSRQSSLFFNELLKEASRAGFDQLALEVGPNAAEILTRLSDNSDQTVANLSAFLKKYKSKNFKWPIPFFKGVEDAEFLKTARALNYGLWGLDQEYTLGAAALFDELMLTVEGQENYADINKLKAKASKFWSKAEGKKQNCQSLNGEPIQVFFKQFDNDNKKARKIIDALKSSWEIYCHYENEEYRENNQKRIAYMRSNFQRHVEALENESDKAPKVIAKMGSYHTTKVKSPLGYEDVGHLMNQMAEARGSKTLYIRYLRRFWLGKDKVDAKGYANSRVFLTVGKRDQWGLIDLRPLREKIRSGEITATKAEINEIFNYDLMLMAPEDKWVKNNF